MAVASLVLGIITIVLSIPSIFIPFLPLVVFVMGVPGIVLAGISIKHGTKATGGLVCSIIGTVFSIPWALIYIIAFIIALIG